MPRKKRKKKSRDLWLNIRYRCPARLNKEDIKGALKDSIRRGRATGDYTLLNKVQAVIEWRNKEDEPMREAAWEQALAESAVSSPGFDTAILDYLKRW